HVTRSQPHQLVTLAKEKRVRANNQSAVFLLDNCYEGCVDLTFGAGVQETDVRSEGARSILHFPRFGRRRRKSWIDKHRNGSAIGYKLPSKLQPLRPHFRSHNGRAREIAPRPVKTGNKSSLNWVAPESEDDRYGPRRCLGRQRRRLTTGRSNHCNLTADQFGSELGQSIVAAFCPTILYCDVLTFEIADLAQTLAKRLRSEEHTSELQSRGHLVCRLLLEKKKKIHNKSTSIT